MSNKMSVTRALRELKTYDDRITKAIGDISVAKAMGYRNSDDEKRLFKNKALGNLEKAKALIANRQTIKNAVVLSNAKTTVTIGGELMTVAEAIEYKSSISSTKSLLNRLRAGYNTEDKSVERHNSEVEKQAHQEVSANFTPTEGTDQAEVVKSLKENFIKMNSLELVAVNGIEDEIEKLDDYINIFEADVDIILSESNTRTEIEVDFS